MAANQFTAGPVYACAPKVERGKPTVLNGDPKNVNMLYACGTAIIIRNVENPAVADVYDQHVQPTTCAKYCPSGFYIASGDTAGNLRIWDTVNVEHILKNEYRVLSGVINDMDWSPDNQRMVIGGDGRERFGAAILADGGTSVGSIDGHSKAITAIAFKPSRPFRAVTGSEDFSSNFYEGPPFKFKKSSKGHSRFVNCVRFSPDGNKYVTVGSDKKGIVYDGKTGDQIGELAAEGAHTGGIYQCCWSPDGTQLLTVSGDKTAKIWDMTSYACVTTFTFGAAAENQQLGCLWQGDSIVTLSLGGDLSYLDVANPDKPKRVVVGHNKKITALTFDEASQQYLSADYTGQIIAWNKGTAEMARFTGTGHSNQVSSIDVNADNIFTASMDDSVRITPRATKEYGASLPVEAPATGVACGKKDTSLAIVTTIKGIFVIRGGAVVGNVANAKSPQCVAISPEENEVAVGCEDGVHLFSLSGSSLTPLVKLEQHRGTVTSVKYSPDGTMLASCDASRYIYTWNRDGANTTVKNDGWCFHTARVNQVNWSPNSKYLVSAGLDADIYVFTVADAKRINIKNAHRGGVTAVTFVNDTTIVSAGTDSCLREWNLNF